MGFCQVSGAKLEEPKRPELKRKTLTRWAGMLSGHLPGQRPMPIAVNPGAVFAYYTRADHTVILSTGGTEVYVAESLDEVAAYLEGDQVKPAMIQPLGGEEEPRLLPGAVPGVNYYGPQSPRTNLEEGRT